MRTFPYVEDYLELLGGFTVQGHSCQISLARYDVSIVGNMSSGTAYGQSLTDRQADLAVKLILKYRRQFFKQGVDITPVENPQWRTPLRKVDRTLSALIEDDMIKLKFPYNRAMIDQLQDQRMFSCGRMEYFRKDRVWHIALTEPNVKWTYEWAVNNNFEIDPKFQELYDLVESAPRYEIELVKTDKGYDIVNAAASLRTYITEKLGGFGEDNIIKLLDNAGRLGYTVNDLVWQQDLNISSDMRSALEFIGGKHRCYITPDDTMFNWILDYAELTQREPIYIYDPTNTPEIHKILDQRYDKHQIVKFDDKGQTGTLHYSPFNVKILYAVKIPVTWNILPSTYHYPGVPLVITTVEMMYGGRRMALLNEAEKVVYYCNKLKEQN